MLIGITNGNRRLFLRGSVGKGRTAYRSSTFVISLE